MKKDIEKKLITLEKQHEIKILFAIESGSRAWGFPSKDSDFDVRFVYVRPLDNYLKVIPESDFLDFPINDDLDINGWDLKKFLKHLYASNATPFEWMQSPIFYQNEVDFYREVFQILPEYFCQQTTMHHYLGLVKKQIQQLNSEKIKLKTFFYILRSLLSAKFSITENKYPPMELKKMLFLIDKPELINEIEQLIETKNKGTEKDLGELSSVLFLFLNDLYQELSLAEKVKTKGNFNLKLLENTYLKLIKDADHRFFKAK